MKITLYVPFMLIMIVKKEVTFPFSKHSGYFNCSNNDGGVRRKKGGGEVNGETDVGSQERKGQA